jgi:hypothetical protein
VSASLPTVVGRDGDGRDLAIRYAPAASRMKATAAEELDRLADVLDLNSIAANTKRGYRADWTSWLVFCQQQNVPPLPAAIEDVRRYLAQLSEVGGRKGKKLKAKPRSGILRR